MPYTNTDTDMYTNTGMYANTDMYTDTGMYTNTLSVTLSVDDDELLLITCSGKSGIVYTVTETVGLEGATFEEA